MSGISQEEAAVALRFFSSMNWLGHARAKVAATNYDDPKLLMQMTKGSEEVRSLTDILAFNRVKFGAEFLLGWTMRDRNAQKFAEFLEQCRRNSGNIT